MKTKFRNLSKIIFHVIAVENKNYKKIVFLKKNFENN